MTTTTTTKFDHARAAILREEQERINAINSAWGRAKTVQRFADTKNAPITTYERAEIIAYAAVKTMARAAGDIGKAADMRRDMRGRDARAKRMYTAMDAGNTYTSDDGVYNGAVLIAGHTKPITIMPDNMSDSQDLIQVAALAIIEALPNIDHDAPHVLSEDIAKQAFKAVHKYVYSQNVQLKRTRKETDTNGIERVYTSYHSRVSFVADMVIDEKTGECIDKGYIRNTLYFDATSYEDIKQYEYLMHILKNSITERQEEILTMRMQGLSIVQIAARLGVAQTTISTHMARMQDIARAIMPDAVRYFSSDIRRSAHKERHTVRVAPMREVWTAKRDPRMYCYRAENATKRAAHRWDRFVVPYKRAEDALAIVAPHSAEYIALKARFDHTREAIALERAKAQTSYAAREYVASEAKRIARGKALYTRYNLLKREDARLTMYDMRRAIKYVQGDAYSIDIEDIRNMRKMCGTK